MKTHLAYLGGLQLSSCEKLDNTRQSFVESALASPPIFALLHLLTPSSA
jgi:hypothetical protein